MFVEWCQFIFEIMIAIYLVMKIHFVRVLYFVYIYEERNMTLTNMISYAMTSVGTMIVLMIITIIII